MRYTFHPSRDSEESAARKSGGFLVSRLWGILVSAAATACPDGSRCVAGGSCETCPDPGVCNRPECIDGSCCDGTFAVACLDADGCWQEDDRDDCGEVRGCTDGTCNDCPVNVCSDAGMTSGWICTSATERVQCELRGVCAMVDRTETAGSYETCVDGVFVDCGDIDELICPGTEPCPREVGLVENGGYCRCEFTVSIIDEEILSSFSSGEWWIDFDLQYEATPDATFHLFSWGDASPGVWDHNGSDTDSRVRFEDDRYGCGTIAHHYVYFVVLADCDASLINGSDEAEAFLMGVGYAEGTYYDTGGIRWGRVIRYDPPCFP